jgi:3-dehydrotetronate 4-kinase
MTKALKVGCIADDFTGATDLANNLVRAGMRVEQILGVPQADAVPAEVDAVVVALKSRTAPVAQAVDESLAAARWLRQHGAAQLYFKVCSTFDSTPQGNIGPVAEALAALTGARVVPVTPAFPENGRTVFMGHLFVGTQLLSDSPMRLHPLTPMTDANLVRVLQAQLRSGRCSLVPRSVVAQGANALRGALDALQPAAVTAPGGVSHFAVVDAVQDSDLQHIAQACAGLPLVVAGSGVAIGLPRIHGLSPNPEAARLPTVQGAAAIVSGSCSAATQAQVAHFMAAGGTALAVDPLAAADTATLAGQALRWAEPLLGSKPVLIYSTAAPEAVRAVQAKLGADQAATRVESLLAQVAHGLVQRGVGRLIVAGGETSGACVQQLGLVRLRIGPQIDPGVPWCYSAEQGLHVALKSGNFGGVDFFSRAWAALD